MANVNFSIGSTFSGEGFKQLQQAMQSTSRNVKQAAQVTTQMVSTLGMMDQAFSQTANAIGGMMSAISSGNPYLITMQTTMTGITLYQKRMQEEADKLKERMDELAESVKVAHDRLVQSVNAETIDNYARLIQECKSLTAEFDRMTKQSEDFVASVNKLDATRDIGKNLDYQIKRIQAENSGASKSTLAKMDLEQTRTEGEQKIKYATEKVEGVIEKRTTIQQKQVIIDEQISRLTNHQSELKKQLNDFGSIDADIAKTTTEKLKENKREIEKLVEQREDYRVEEEKISREILQAKEELLNVEKQAKLDRITAEGRLTDAYDEEAREEEKSSSKSSAKDKEKEIENLKSELRSLYAQYDDQKIRDENDREIGYRLNQQIIAGGGGSDGSYRDANGVLHLTSSGRNNNLWGSATVGALGDLKAALTNYANQGIKGSSGTMNKQMSNWINSKQFEAQYRPQGMSNKDWNTYKKEMARAGRDLAHSGKYNDLSREAGGGGGSGGSAEQQAVQVSSPELSKIAEKIETIEQKLNDLGLQ